MAVCQGPGCRKSKTVRMRNSGKKLCDDCEEIDVSSMQGATNGDDSEDDQSEPRIIINELLCYVFTYLDNSTPEMIMNVVENSFSNDEITDAKDVLWREYNEVLDDRVQRRTGPSRSAIQATVEDIVLNGVNIIKNSGCEGDVIFCARNLKKLPKVSPEEYNIQAMFNKIMKLEQQMVLVQQQTAKNSAYIERDIQGGSSSVVPERHNNPVTSRECNGPESQSKLLPDLSTYPPLPVPLYSGAVQANPSSSTSFYNRKPKDSPARKKDPTNEWLVQRQEKRKRIKEAARNANVVVGVQTNTGLRGGVDAKTIFVYNVGNRYSGDDIRKHMKDSGVEVVHLKQTSHMEAPNKSFKVMIDNVDYDKVMNAGFWEKGIRCREWIN